jgi:hypothetical protein
VFEHLLSGEIAVTVIDNCPVVKLLFEMLLIIPVDSEMFKLSPVYVELSGQLVSVYITIQSLELDIDAYCSNKVYPEYYELLNIYY